MKQLIELMSEFGASFYTSNKFKFPLKMYSSNVPVGIRYKAGVSAQLKSAVILAGLNSYGDTEILEDKSSRNHTENMLIKNSNVIKIKGSKKKIIKVQGKKILNSINIDVPGDPSSAAFFTALTLLNKKSSIQIKNVGLNPTRVGFYNLLKKQGAKIKFSNTRKENNEIRGNIFVQSSSYGEGFPNVVAEAMACGTPCVVTNVGDAAFIVGKTGWTVPPNNSLKLAKAIEQSLSEFRTKNWNKRRHKARLNIKEKFEISKMISSYNKVWRGVNKRYG